MAPSEGGKKKTQSLKQRMQTVLDENGEELKDIYHEVTASDIISQAHKAHKTMRNAYDGIGEITSVAKQARGNHGSQGEENPAPDPSVFALAPIEFKQHPRSSSVYYAKLPTAAAMMLNRDKAAMASTGPSATSSAGHSCNWSGTHHGVPMAPIPALHPLLVEDPKNNGRPTPSLSKVVPRPPTEVTHTPGDVLETPPEPARRLVLGYAGPCLDLAESDSCDVPDETLSLGDNSASRGLLSSGENVVPSPRPFPPNDSPVSSRRPSFKSQSFRLASHDDDNDDDDGGWGPLPDGVLLGGDSLFLSGAAEQALTLLRGALQRSPSKSNFSRCSSLRRMPSSNALGRTNFDVNRECGSPGAAAKARRENIDLSQVDSWTQLSGDLTHVGGLRQPRASNTPGSSPPERTWTVPLPCIKPSSPPCLPSSLITSPTSAVRLSAASGTIQHSQSGGLETQPEPPLCSPGKGDRGPRVKRNASRLSVVGFSEEEEEKLRRMAGSGLASPHPLGPLSGLASLHPLSPSSGLASPHPLSPSSGLASPHPLSPSAGLASPHALSPTGRTASPHPLSPSAGLGTAPTKPRSRSCMTAGCGVEASNAFAGGSVPLPFLQHPAVMSGQHVLSGSTHSSGGFSRQLTVESIDEEGGEGGYLAPSYKADYRSGSSMGFRAGTPTSPDPRRASAMGSLAPMQMRPCGGSLGGREHFRSVSTQPGMGGSKGLGPKDKVLVALQHPQTLDRPHMAGPSPRSASCTPGATAAQGGPSPPLRKWDKALQQRLAKYNRPRVAPTPDALYSGSGGLARSRTDPL